MSDYEEYKKKDIVNLIASGTAILHAKDGPGLPKLKADIYDHYYFVYDPDNVFTNFLCCRYCKVVMCFNPKNETKRY